MSDIIRLKIDVTKIDKARLFTGRNGAKYLDCTLIKKREVGQFGDTHMITQDITKEERQGGMKAPIIGNGKEVETADRQPAPPPAQRRAPTPPATSTGAPPQSGDDDDLPF